MTIELEAKLLPSEGFIFPSLGGLRPGTVPRSLPPRALDATYYDTADLDLARWGITLRHRTGETGPPWTLKLPEDERGERLSRHELRFDGAPGEVPDDARDLVRAFIGAKTLRSIVRLHTARAPIELQKASGEPLLEIVDDTVTAYEDDQVTCRFREVELEATSDSRASRRVLGAATQRLVDAGCRVGKPLPKLVRALGAPAVAPPLVTIHAVDASSTLRELIQHAIATSVVEIFRHDPGTRLGEDPEELHRFRVAARRLRSDLGPHRDFLDRERARELRRELRWLGAAVGSVRDLDVLGERVRARARAVPETDREAADRVLLRLQRRSSEARAEMLAALRSARYDELLAALVTTAAAPPLARGVNGIDRPAEKAAKRLVRNTWTPLRKAAEGLAANPTDAELHNVRILAKRCRYAAEGAKPACGREAAAFARAIEAVQTVLGDHNDTVVAEAWLRGAAAEEPTCGLVAGQLIAMERLDRARLRAEWPSVWQAASRGKLRRWLA